MKIFEIRGSCEVIHDFREYAQMISAANNKIATRKWLKLKPLIFYKTKIIGVLAWVQMCPLPCPLKRE